MTFDNIYNFVSTWQTLIGAILALIAALWTVKEMRKQSKAEADRHLDSLVRKKLAARAQMPDALSEMGSYVGHLAGF